MTNQIPFGLSDYQSYRNLPALAGLGTITDAMGIGLSVEECVRRLKRHHWTWRRLQDFGRKTLRSWDYQNFRVNIITAPMYVLTNTLGLIVALHISLGTAASLQTVSSRSPTLRRPHE